MKRNIIFISALMLMLSIFVNGAIVDQRTIIANRLFKDWKENNRTDALKIASPSAVKKLFKTKGKGAKWTFSGCESLACAFQYEGGAAIFHLRKLGEKRYKVNSVEFIAD